MEMPNSYAHGSLWHALWLTLCTIETIHARCQNPFLLHKLVHKGFCFPGTFHKRTKIYPSKFVGSQGQMKEYLASSRLLWKTFKTCIRQWKGVGENSTTLTMIISRPISLKHTSYEAHISTTPKRTHKNKQLGIRLIKSNSHMITRSLQCFSPQERIIFRKENLLKRDKSKTQVHLLKCHYHPSFLKYSSQKLKPSLVLLLSWSLFLYVSMAPTTPFSLLFASPFSPPFIGSTPANVLSPLQDPFGA